MKEYIIYDLQTSSDIYTYTQPVIRIPIKTKESPAILLIQSSISPISQISAHNSGITNSEYSDAHPRGARFVNTDLEEHQICMYHRPSLLHAHSTAQRTNINFCMCVYPRRSCPLPNNTVRRGEGETSLAKRKITKFRDNGATRRVDSAWKDSWARRRRCVQWPRASLPRTFHLSTAQSGNGAARAPEGS